MTKDALDVGFTVYGCIGLLLINTLTHLAYFLTRPLWVQPDLVFITIVGYGIEKFSLLALIITIASVIGGSTPILFTNKWSWPWNILLIITSLAFSLLLILTIIPFSIMLIVLYIGLTATIVASKTFRHFTDTSDLPPNTTLSSVGDDFRLSIRLAHNRWLQLQRDSIWLTASIVFAQLLQFAIIFQSQIFPYLAPIEENPYALIFARYQFAIMGIAFLWFVGGLLYGTTLFCYSKLMSLERIIVRQC